MKYLKPLPLLLIPFIWFVFYTNVFSCTTSYIKKGEDAFQQGKYEDAENYYSKAIEAGIKDPGVLSKSYYMRAGCRLQVENYEGCVEDADQVILLGQSPGGYLVRGVARSEMQMHKQAVEDLSLVLEKGMMPESAKNLALLKRATSLFALGESKLAVKDCTALINAHAKEYEARIIRAQAWLVLKMTDNFFDDCNVALNIGGGQDSFIFILRAAAYMALGRDEEGLKGSDQVIAAEKTGKGLSFLYTTRAQLLSNLGEYEKCLDDLGKAIATGEDLSSAYSQRCKIWEIRGEDEKCIADAGKALELGKKDMHVYVYRAKCLQRLGRVTEADLDWARAIELRPQSDLPHFYRGLAHAYHQEYAQAVSCWREGVAADEQNNGDMRYERAGLGHMRDACDKGKATLKNNSDVYLVSGWLYLQAKDRPRAEQDLATAVRLNPGSDIAKKLLASAKEKETGLIEKDGKKMLRLRAPAS
ncbi:MAG: tetratricopeptide repeat protein [Proteobacteria bacterium]|nr:tetratricopeptide repeat protein [Pseudomonadota bacterium]